MPNSPKYDPSVIEKAPLAPFVEEASKEAESSYLDLIGQLSSSLETAQADLVELKSKKSIDEVRAAMLQPYSDKVYVFVAWYCAAVGILVTLSGFKSVTHFVLSDTILGIISGSTAVSVIGLIGMVLAGLFGSPKKP